ncbi:MAG: hypothetical protein WCG27_03325 [Pseudomonadota bacterium]
MKVKFIRWIAMAAVLLAGFIITALIVFNLLFVLFVLPRGGLI